MLKFKVEMDDIVAFNQQFVTTSSLHRASRIRGVVIFATVFICLGVIQAYQHKSFVPLVIWSIVTTVFGIWMYRKSGKVSAKTIRKNYSEDKDKLVLCDHEMESLQDGFISRTPLSESRTKFSAIVRIDETPSHIFVYLGSMQAHIIPKGKVYEGNVSEFVALLKNGIKAQEAAH